MRSLLAWVLGLGHLTGFLALSYPSLREKAALSRERDRLEVAIQERASELGDAERTQIALEKARTLLGEPWLDRADFLRQLRDALLELEGGLALRRLSIEYRFDGRPTRGFRPGRVQVRLRGAFPDLATYLDRLSGWRAPLAPVDLRMMDDPTDEGQRVLHLSFMVSWPEDPP
jgi:hypothetical protein